MYRDRNDESCAIQYKLIECRYLHIGTHTLLKSYISFRKKINNKIKINNKKIKIKTV